MTIENALATLYPGTHWVLEGSDYSGLTWLEDNIVSKPTEEELTSWVAAHLYQELRSKEYPPAQDLADALVHKENGDASHYEAYVAACNAVKAKYPRP